MGLDDQRSILFLQPDFDQTNTADDVGAPLVYLKLGSAKDQEDLSSARLRGDDLLTTADLTTSRYSKLFTDDMRESACSSSSDDSASPYRQPTHHDASHSKSDGLNETLADPSTSYYRSAVSGSTTSTQTRVQLSAELVGDGSSTDARGGWRDHSDGNRITTVRGDRVDVVFGNYKRVVLGRVSGTEVGPTSYEASGGHIFARSSANHLQHYAIEHVSETDISGDTRWKVVERSTSGDCVYRYEGKIREYYDGPTFRRRTGVKDSQSNTTNPDITREYNYGAVEETISGSSFSRSLTADDYTKEVTGSASHTETTSGILIHHKRGSWSEMGFTYEENRRTTIDVDARIYIGRGSFEAGAFRHETTAGWFFHGKVGARLAAQIGPVSRLHYGSRCRWYCMASPWVRVMFAPLNVDVNIGILCANMALFQFTSKIDHGEYKLGDLKVKYIRSLNSIGQFKQFALRAEL